MSEGDSFTPSGEDGTRGFDFLFCGGGALLLFVLRAVAGACVGRWTGQPRMPPRERQHEGLGGVGDWGIVSHPLTWHLLRLAGISDVREGFGVLFGKGAAAGR